MQGHEEKVHNNRSLLEQVGRRKGTPDPEFSHNELCIMQFQQTKHNTALTASKVFKLQHSFLELLFICPI